MCGDLDWITLKAIEKDRSRRYESAAALGHDVERYLANEPVSAVKPTLVYQSRRLAKRHKVAFAASLAKLAALVLGFGVAVSRLIILTQFHNETHQDVDAYSLDFSQDGTMLACGLRAELLLLEVPSLREVGVFRGFSGSVVSVDFSPDRENLIGVDEFGNSQLVNLNVMLAVGDLVGATSRSKQLYSAQFSPSGLTMAISGTQGVRLINDTLSAYIRFLLGMSY